MSELEKQLLRALWQAYREINAICARDGVPFTRDGWPSSVTEEWFRQVRDDCVTAITAATGRPPEPWMPREVQS